MGQAGKPYENGPGTVGRGNWTLYSLDLGAEMTGLYILYFNVQQRMLYEDLREERSNLPRQRS